jgi:phosphate transport system permease protein
VTPIGNTPAVRPAAGTPRAAPRRRGAGGRRTALFAHGEPLIWLTGGSLAMALLMIAGLLALVAWQGFGTFWPGPVLQVVTTDGRTLAGEVTRDETYAPPELQPADAAPGVEPVSARRRLLRIGNFELTGEHFVWVGQHEVAEASRPAWSLVVERVAWGRFYGQPAGFLLGGQPAAATPEAAWELFNQYHAAVRERCLTRRHLETDVLGEINRESEEARLAARRVELEHGAGSPEAQAPAASTAERSAQLQARYAEVRAQIEAIDRENAGYQLLMATADGQQVPLDLANIVRAYPANQLGFFGKLGVYLSRSWEFLSDEPREANCEGGVWPAIFGTVMMTLIMSLLVVPFGVLAALYLREYARPGPLTSAVRIAINNLAGVPSIVFGVFGLGFFCYIVGARFDQAFHAERLPSPTFGTGGILWASLTLALLTLPVVIVATEEALAAVPGSMREGSYACGASRWQTIRRIVLPRALPGIMTGMILALARGAGEVAPLMLVGAVKLAPELPFDGQFPFVHLERSFMHLGFHIYDLGFQSQNSEAAKPMVFTTTLLLIGLVVMLNVAAVTVRARLRSRFVTGKF